MYCTLENLDRVFKMIIEQHADNSEHGEFDDETDLVDAIQRVVNQIEEEPLFMCNSCHEHFPREEMDMEVDEDQDLCKNCNYQSYNEAPYGQD
jgi:hypothetical protein